MSYTSPSTTTTFPGAIDMLGNGYTDFSSPGTDQPMWLGIYYDGASPSMVLTRLDTAGRVLTTNRVPHLINLIQASSDGGCWIAGASQIARLTAEGKPQWTTALTYTFERTDYEFYIHKLVVLPTGSSLFIGNAGRAVLLGEIDGTGKVKWLKGYSYAPRSAFPFDLVQAQDLAVLADGRIVVVGYRDTKPDAFITAFTPTGEVLWTKDLQAPDFELQKSKLVVLADGTLTLAFAQASVREELLLVHLTAEGKLLRARSLAGLSLKVKSIAIAPQGNLTLVGPSTPTPFSWADPTTRRELFIGELDAQWQPQAARSLEKDPEGKWFSGFGAVLNAEGAFRYSVSDLIAPINGGTPTSFRLFKSKTIGARVCSSQSEPVSLVMTAVTPVLTEGPSPDQLPNGYTQRAVSLDIYSFNVQGKRDCP